MHRGKQDGPHAMHAELMSPERKRKTAQETAAAMRSGTNARGRRARPWEEERAARLRARTRRERADEAERRAADARELRRVIAAPRRRAERISRWFAAAGERRERLRRRRFNPARGE